MFEDNVEIPSHELDAQTWDMHGVDARWSHLHFVWTKGRRYRVRAVSRAKPVPRPARQLKITETATRIIVDTGQLKAVINKRQFALFDELRVNPTASRTYRTRILKGSMGPEIWENGQLFATRLDQNAVVEVELHGPLYAVIKAQGAYRAGGQDWAAFTTRIHFWAGTEWIRVVHDLGYREDMTGHEYERAAIVMPFDVGEHFAFAADDDGSRHKGSFAAHGELYLHQLKHDAYRFGTGAGLATGSPIATGKRSNNCWAIASTTQHVRVECHVRNGWQEFPFEAMAGPQRIGVSMQPWHGYEVFGALGGGGHASERELHKLRYAHAGASQRQGLPAEYVAAFNAIDARTDRELTETSADAAAAANWQGMMLRQDFYLRIAPEPASSLAAFNTDDLPAYSALVQSRPIAVPAPQQVQESFVFGPIGTIGDGYPEVFDYVANLVKGDYNPERGAYFGRFRWGAAGRALGTRRRSDRARRRLRVRRQPLRPDRTDLLVLPRHRRLGTARRRAQGGQVPPVLPVCELSAGAPARQPQPHDAVAQGPHTLRRRGERRRGPAFPVTACIRTRCSSAGSSTPISISATPTRAGPSTRSTSWPTAIATRTTTCMRRSSSTSSSTTAACGTRSSR